MFVAGLAAVEKLKVENNDLVQNCSATAGLSLGEYTALVFSGALSFEDGLTVLQAAHEWQHLLADTCDRWLKPEPRAWRRLQS